MLLFLMLFFSNSEPISHFLAKQTEFGKKNLIDNIFNANIFIKTFVPVDAHNCSKIRDECLFYYFEFIFVCLYAANIFAAMTRRFLST